MEGDFDRHEGFVVHGGKATRDLRLLLELGEARTLTDRQLLGRFVDRREGAIFEAIVLRHGPMVWGVCRRVLRDHHDAEDAFQATFLVLARRAASVAQGEKLGNWLYGVAHQTARKARAMRAKRRAREGQVTDLPEPEAAGVVTHDDCRGELDRELSRLPEKYRLPIVLCELEGRTHREAAEQIGCPIGTVSSRLSRAKAMLMRRLSRRAVPLSDGSMALLLTREVMSVRMPTHLIGSTARAASLIAKGHPVSGGVVSVEVVILIGGVTKTMLLTRLRYGVILLVLALGGTGVIGTGIARMIHQISASGVEPIPEVTQGAAQAEPEPPRTAPEDPIASPPQNSKELEDAIGKWTFPNATAYEVARYESNAPGVHTDTGEYSTIAPFHEVVRFYVEKSGFVPPNWSILGRIFPGDKINIPGSWSQWGGGKSVSIHHHIRPESASAGLLMTNFDDGEAVGVSISCGLGDKRTFIQIARHSTALAKKTPGERSDKKIDRDETNLDRKALLSKDLSGTWRGERDGAKVEVEFKGGGKATWEVSTRRDEVRSALVRVDMVMVDDQGSGSILLLLNLLRPLPSGKSSLVMGRLTRGRGGKVELTMEPDALVQSEDYYQLVKGLPLIPDSGGQ